LRHMDDSVKLEFDLRRKALGKDDGNKINTMDLVEALEAYDKIKK